jgi:hypothetical protein
MRDTTPSMAVLGVCRERSARIGSKLETYTNIETKLAYATKFLPPSQLIEPVGDDVDLRYRRCGRSHHQELLAVGSNVELPTISASGLNETGYRKLFGGS